MSPEEVYALAGAVARSFRLPPDQTDDLRQEAAIGMFYGARNLDRSRPESDQRGYLCRVGRSKALNYLSWRARSSREAQVEDCQDAQAVYEHRTGIAAVASPEDYVAAASTCARALEVIEAGMKKLSSQQAALLRFKLGREEMRADLARLGKGPRGAVSNVARRKLLAVAEEMGASDIVTPELLLRLFGHHRDE